MSIAENALAGREPNGLRNLWRRLVVIKFWRLYRLVGRFETGRVINRCWRRFMRRLAPPSWAMAGTVFETLLVAEAVSDLRHQGYYTGLQLHEQLVSDIYDHARQTPCQRQPGDAEFFLIDAIRDGFSPEGKPVAVADVDARVPCAAISRLAGDAKLVETVSRYLGYSPRHVVARLYWSPVSTLPEDHRRWNGQTIDYHYDIERGNALYVYFYITDVGRTDGAHVVVAGSHLPKPLGMKLASTRQPERRVLDYYGEESVVIIEGRAGYGFIEDPGCFHKVLPPQHMPRLMLQFRYT